MKLKWVFCIIIVSLPVIMTHTNLMAASTSQIDEVLRKTVLSEQDFRIIDGFLRSATDVLVDERDLTIIPRHRDAILTRKGTQGQYVEKFNELAVGYLTQAFSDAEKLKPEKRRTAVLTNLLILVDGLQDVRFVLLPLNQLKDKNVMIRYWAIQCLTNPEIVNQLNDSKAENPNTPKEITDQFKKVIPEINPESLGFIARFAVTINIPQGQELLLSVADQRIKSYADWAVKNEFTDSMILKMLESKISNPSGNSDTPALAQRFAQLYSYVIQRYVKGRAFLNETQIKELITVIAETEDKCINNMTGEQRSLRSAIEQDNMNSLMNEHNTLLGDETNEGKLPAKYRFNYGRENSGSTRTAPLTLQNRITN